MANSCNLLSGSAGYFKIAKEAEFSVYKESGYSKVPFIDNKISFKQNLVESKVIAEGREPTKKGLGNVEVGGDFTIPADTVSFATFLEGIFGKREDTTVGGKVEKTFTFAQDCIPSYAIEKGFNHSNVSYLARGIKFNTLSLEFGGEGDIVASIGTIGKSSQMITIVGDAVYSDLTAAAATGTNVLSVSDASNFEVGAKITLEKLGGTASSNSPVGSRKIVLGSGEGANFKSGNFVKISSVPYSVSAVEGDIIYLSSSLENAVVGGTTKVYLADEQNKVSSISGNDITLVSNLENDYDTGDLVYTKDTLTIPSYNIFQNTEVSLSSSTQPEAVIGVQKGSIKIENGLTGERTIDSKGSFSFIAEGKVNVELSLSLIFTPKNARLLEEAKSGSDFDITLSFTNNYGEVLSFTMPHGILQAGEPSIEGPATMKFDVVYAPFSKDSLKSLTAKLIS